MSTPTGAGPTVYYEDSSYEDAVSDATEYEFGVWRNSLPRHTESRNPSMSPFVGVRAGVTPVFPRPSTEDGLPDGWQVRWHASYTAEDPMVGTIDYEVVLFEREPVGWGVVFHSNAAKSTAPRTSLWAHTSMTAAGLYVKAMQVVDSPTGVTNGVENDIRDYLLSCYNMNDPAEAAEATLVGLGARITVFPQALRR